MDYNKLTLRQLQVEIKKISRSLAAIQLLQTPDEDKIKPIKQQTEKLKLIQEVVTKRTTKPIRCSLPKRIQRQIGLLPSINL
jgi:hypothetical protein